MRLIPQTITAARLFVAKHHRHNKPPKSALFAVGLEHDGELVGVALCGRPVARMLQDGKTAEVTRTCTLPQCPKGGVSKLLNACRSAAAAIGYERVVTYTLQSESGASLRGAGWVQAELLEARPGWDRPSRSREPGMVDNTAKIRWEAAAPGGAGGKGEP